MPSLRALAFATLLSTTLLASAQFQPPNLDGNLNSRIDKLATGLTRHRREQVAALHDKGAALARQQAVRATMLRLVGPLPERTPLNPVILGETALPGLRIQKILFDSQPGFHVTALLYLPQATLVDHALPAILMTPGHIPSGKASDFLIASAFARNGFAVLSYDPLGQGERLQYPDPHDQARSLAGAPTGEHGEASLQPILLGESIARYFLWDAMRGLDYLQTRPEIDPNRLGAFGCSGGGAVTALLGAVDPRLHAIGTACYITTWDALLATLGPQDAEQSTPGWLAAGPDKSLENPGRRNLVPLDFADYVEAAAPTPYAIISTTEDMFPFAGAQATATEARGFYDLFDPNKQPAFESIASPLAFITGPGKHGNLRPMLPRILKFFIDALQPSPFPPVYDDQSPAVQPPPGAFQVTSTGQVATFDPRSETVFSLNLAHARSLPQPHPESLASLQQSIRLVAGLGEPTHRIHNRKPATKSDAPPYESAAFEVTATPLGSSPTSKSWQVTLRRPDGTALNVLLTIPNQVANPSLTLLLLDRPQEVSTQPDLVPGLLASGHAVISLIPRPASPGHADTKSPLLGPWYLPALRSMLVGRTLLGQRVEDTLLAIDYLDGLRLPHQPGLEARASGHLAMVLLHAAVLDVEPAPANPHANPRADRHVAQPARLRRLVLENLPPTWAQTLANPRPQDASEDLLPGVLLQYDLPDLLAALGTRAEVVEPDNPVERAPL